MIFLITVIVITIIIVIIVDTSHSMLPLSRRLATIVVVVVVVVVRNLSSTLLHTVHHYIPDQAWAHSFPVVKVVYQCVPCSRQMTHAERDFPTASVREAKGTSCMVPSAAPSN